MTVGITNEIDENELRDISTLTTDFIKVEEFFLLTNELNNLISQVKQTKYNLSSFAFYENNA